MTAIHLHAAGAKLTLTFIPPAPTDEGWFEFEIQLRTDDFIS